MDRPCFVRLSVVFEVMCSSCRPPFGVLGAARAAPQKFASLKALQHSLPELLNGPLLLAGSRPPPRLLPLGPQPLSCGPCGMEELCAELQLNDLTPLPCRPAETPPSAEATGQVRPAGTNRPLVPGQSQPLVAPDKHPSPLFMLC